MGWTSVVKRGRSVIRVIVRAAASGVWFASAACFAYRPVGLAPTPGSQVRIVFTSAITVTTLGSGSDSTRRAYPGVLEANGTIRAAARDTVALRLGELRTARSTLPDVSGQVALLPTAQIARIEERRFQAGTTVLVSVGVAVLALTTFIVIVTAALIRGF